MTNKGVKIFFIAALAGMSMAGSVSAQRDSLSPKFTIDIQGYDPVLSESSKITLETPAKDTATATPPKLDYSIQSKAYDSQYEAATIKAVKVVDNKLPKLYHGLLKAGLGNNGTYLGELFLNSTRSKKSQTGLHLQHLSSEPTPVDAGFGGYSDNIGEGYGKIFLDHSVFTGNIGYTRKVNHYYGFNSNDTLIPRDETRQLYNAFDLGLNYKSTYLTRAHLDHEFGVKYYHLNDKFDVSENDVKFDGKVGKDFSGTYGSVYFMFNYMKKNDTENQLLGINSNPSRNLFTLAPKVKLDGEKFHLNAGLNFTRQYNYEAKYHLYPDIHLDLPIAENVLGIFAEVSGYVQKNTYRSFLDENPFINHEVSALVNTNHKIIFKGGVQGNFSAATSFEAHFTYDAFERMPLYINTGEDLLNKFNITYDDGSMMDIHAEFHHRPNDKFLFGLKADYYSYSMDVQEKPWHKPLNEITLSLGYNIGEQILASLDIYGSGTRYAYDPITKSSVNLKGYADINVKVEYRYTKILSVFLQLNNLGFSRYYRWENYPTQRLNVVGGLTYAFWGDKTR